MQFIENENGIIDTKLYQKKGYICNYTNRRSNHPEHCLMGIIYSELLRGILISSRHEYYKESKDIFYKLILERGYTQYDIRNCNKPSYYKRSFYINKILNKMKNKFEKNIIKNLDETKKEKLFFIKTFNKLYCDDNYLKLLFNQYLNILNLNNIHVTIANRVQKKLKYMI